jgi:hypothetical protein
MLQRLQQQNQILLDAYVALTIASLIFTQNQKQTPANLVTRIGVCSANAAVHLTSRFDY